MSDRYAWIEDVLKRWGVWSALGGSSRGSRGLVASYGEKAGRHRNDGPVQGFVPVDDLEAMETDAFVAQLPSVLRQVAIEVWRWETTQAMHAKRLRISTTTLAARRLQVLMRYEQWHEARKKRNFANYG